MKELITGFVAAAQSTLRPLITKWYQVTVCYPRRLPTTEREIEDLKFILMNHFGLPDDPRIWCTVFGQICSVKPISVRKPYRHYVNVARRLEINNLANGLKSLEIMKLQDKLQKKMEEMGLADVPEGTPRFSGEVPGLRPSQEGMVSYT